MDPSPFSHRHHCCRQGYRLRGWHFSGWCARLAPAVWGVPKQCACSRGAACGCHLLGFVHPSIPLAVPAPRAKDGETGSFGKAAVEGRDGSCYCPCRRKPQPQLSPCWMREHPCMREPVETAPGRRRQAHGPRRLVSIGNQAGKHCLSSRLGAEELFVLFLSSRY